jgi:hypothetical protein
VTAECQGRVDSFDTALVRDRAASVRYHDYQAFIASAEFGPCFASFLTARPPRKIINRHEYEHNNGNDSQIRRSQSR